MHFVEAIIMGLVQGLTEFLPVSSSAHLRILGAFLPGAQDPGAAFTAITQIGTEAAVVLFFWRDIARIIAQWFRALFGRIPRNDPDARMGWLIIIGSIPIVVLGIAFQDQIETVFRSLWLVAGMLILFGVLLGIADAVGAQKRKLGDITYPKGIIFGFAQALALIPGVSRSGGTITAGLFMGFERAAAARYAFLLAIPAVFGSGFYQLYKSKDAVGSYFTLGETAVATAVAFVVALGVIAFFMNYISKHSFLPFVIYRVALGSTVLVLLATGVIAAN
ncbi:undecaprenyl-diphosphate phosphatase [Microbacterium rhizomatis]|uniref:Undecaprenyl-diphosphatase n=1 Tax=Microbacterium rhizomatis TaxID=1631477 RepID=A0A5J5J3Q1_9MICO|nr:undecaprenyl-diphosphate phosphatase [Microbacterium rhizomatis]KAA9110622.1 undecaprenyl-diphosphate phosphatase [Microbacterium rhizomatis]